MAGLFDTLSLGSRSLSTYRKAIDTTGHNLANVHTDGYTRQRLEIEATTVDLGRDGPAGTGAEATKIVRLRNEFATVQLQTEASIEGSLSVRHDVLQQALTSLQEGIDRNTADGTSTKGLSQGLSDFFASAQNVATNPTSIPDRQAFVQKAQELGARFNLTDSRLAALEQGLNGRVQMETDQANSLVGEIASLNEAIVSEETLSDGYANDLRDAREAKIEELSKLVKIDAAENVDGSMNISVGGNLLIDGRTVVNRLETMDPGDGRLQVRISGQTDALALTGGSIQGAISVRDGQLSTLRDEINTLASAFISEVNAVHNSGYSLTGTTGQDLFTGTNAGDIRVNDTLRDASLLQLSGSPTEPGDNTVGLALAGLVRQANTGLGGQTFSGKQAQTVAWLGQEVASARTELQDQVTISKFFRNQRDAVAGVSVDEEMTNLVMFQKAFQASAKLISMTDEMLSTIIQM